MLFNMNVDLTGTQVVLTGAAGGIGRAIARAFVKSHAKLLLIDCSLSVEDVATDLISEFDVPVYAMVADLRENNMPAEAANYCQRVLGGCSVLINNAGMGYVASLSEMTKEQWSETIKVNVECPFLLSQAFANTCMIPAKRGKIINMASQAGIVALADQSAYCASKAALMALTRSMALEWGAYGITANCIVPTVVETEAALKSWAGEVGAKHRAEIPVGRFGKPEEVAQACLFLASNASDMMSGSNLMLDGGYTIR